jgi:hypothetical protein
VKLPFVSREKHESDVRFYRSLYEAQRVLSANMAESLNAERDRYERLVDKLTAKPAPEVFTAPTVTPLPLGILEALDAMSLYGAVRGANEAMARRLLGSRVMGAGGDRAYHVGVMFDGTADEYVPDAAFPEDDEDA